MKKDIQQKIDQEFTQSLVKQWCIAHGVNPTGVTYENGKLIIPIKF